MTSLINDNYGDSTEFEIKRDRSKVIKVVSILAAVAVTVAILAGYLIWRKWHAESVAAEQSSQSDTARPALPVKVQILMDEPIRKGPQVTIGGNIRNISTETLSNISVELELTHKKDGGTEARTIGVEPKELAPDQQGKYSLTLTGDYNNLKLLRITTGPQSQEIGFKSAPGAKRPFEGPSRTTKTIIVNRPRSTKNGEEFINTPDNPDKIP